MPAQDEMSLKKIFSYALIGSVAVSALFGILAILMGNFGDMEIRILLTSLTISATSLCGISCGASLEAKRAKILPIAGVALALVSAVLVIAGIWGVFSSQEYWKCTATVVIFAVACAHMSLLLLARLSERYRWSIWAAYGAIFGGAIVLSSMFWGDFDLEWVGRLFGVLAILASAFSITIPIFHRLSREEILLNGRHEEPLLADVECEIAELNVRLNDLEQLRTSLRSRQDENISS